MAKGTSVTLRMSEELKAALQELALEDRRTLSSYIEMVLEQHADQRPAGEGAHSERLKVYRGQNQRHGRKAKDQ